jgi:hypothetical protein
VVNGDTVFHVNGVFESSIIPSQRLQLLWDLCGCTSLKQFVHPDDTEKVTALEVFN